VAESLGSPADGSWVLPDLAATTRFGRVLARCLPVGPPAPLVLYLEGDLGAGKTSLVRGLLAGLGHEGRVPSPTYTLVEPYALPGYRVLHVDLYRLRDPAELDDLGLADELAQVDPAGRGRLLLAEWPDRGADRLPPPDLLISLAIRGEGRSVSLASRTGAGAALLAQVQQGLRDGF